MKEVLIPEDRIGVVMSVKRKLESKTSTSVTRDNNSFSISGEAVDVMTCENIIKAMGRGFSPHKAFLLSDDSMYLVIVELPDKKKSLLRIRSRLIGTRGKCRRNLERLTGTQISVYGKTASIIGDFEDADRCRHAVELLVKGVPHKAVYGFLEGK